MHILAPAGPYLVWFNKFREGDSGFAQLSRAAFRTSSILRFSSFAYSCRRVSLYVHQTSFRQIATFLLSISTSNSRQGSQKLPKLPILLLQQVIRFEVSKKPSSLLQWHLSLQMKQFYPPDCLGLRQKFLIGLKMRRKARPLNKYEYIYEGIKKLMA